MEDALAPRAQKADFRTHNRRLNPCFNGRCTRTVEFNRMNLQLQAVLILVLMEDALAQTYKKHITV